ncbi:TonB-dependent receptor [Niveispirillum sp.]|uniref:TonB-dependent receptor n=1 Tax=Niveispirillum sp. TaxID=1917217 RepID=UPI001B758DD4|nr:TonB-dependent receptor [Niveispirillum sp.]MBP7336719.1 TonB-dependent receptor [Niveispirillum sp.]
MRLGTRQLLRLATSTLALTAGASGALAQATADNTPLMLEEIIVSATKRLVSAQSVPQSITAVSQADIQESGAQDFAALVGGIGGVELRSGQAGSGSVAIRGVSELNVENLNGGTGSATGLYVDELPLTAGGLFPDLNTFDLNRVEVLKGPQGTLFGEGSMAGTIRLITNKPKSDGVEAAIDGTLSRFRNGEGSKIANGMLNIPLVEDVLALRVVGFYKDIGGYIDTRLLGTGAITKDTNDDRSKGGRALLRFTPTPALTLDAGVTLSRADRGTRSRAAETYIATLSTITGTDDDMDAYNLTAEYRFDGATLVSTTSYITRDVASISDQAGLVSTVNSVFGMVGVPLRVDGVYADQTYNTKTLAQEVRLVSNAGGAWDWTVGAFYKKHEFTYDLFADGQPAIPSAIWIGISQALTGGKVTIPDSLTTRSDATTKQIAGFGEISYDVSDRVELLAGARLFRETRDSATVYGGVFPLLTAQVLPGSVASEGKSTLLNPRFTATYRWDKDVITYATVSRGFRSGGQNDLFFFVPGSAESYDPEKLTNYELGLKSTLADGRVILNASLFYLDWQNLQALVGQGPGGIGEVVGNLGDAHSRGIDLDIKALVGDGLELSLSGTLLDAETDDVAHVPDPRGGAPLAIAAGASIPRTSDLSISAAALYRRPLTAGLDGVARAAISHRSSAGTDLARPAEKTPGYETVDIRLGVEGENWAATLFVENLFDVKVPLLKENFADLVTGEDQYSLGRPRNMGVTVRYSF